MTISVPNKIIGSVAVAVALLILFSVLSSNVSSREKHIVVHAMQGPFIVSINVTGQLEAKKSDAILAPKELSEAEIWEIKIDQIVDEGTIVKKGDFVAMLDRSSVLAKISEQEKEIETIQNEKIQIRIDTAIQLASLRDGIDNLSFEIRQKEIALKQSAYEPPATIEQLKMTLWKAEQDYKRAMIAYDLQLQKAVAEVGKISMTYNAAIDRLSSLKVLLDRLTIIAPQDGMVIYKRERGGGKLGQGAVIKLWDPTVATLPDFNKMVSKTFVNEIDISKIKVGQEVNVILDAFPKIKYPGKIVTISNIGEERPFSHENVFEVHVELEDSGPLLKPAMTTRNEIIIARETSSVYIPLEAVFTETDTLSFVYKKRGHEIVKSEIKMGLRNDNSCIIIEGVTKSDELLLSEPKGKYFKFQHIERE
jgi:multidrug efflux pump subunit AcrA (membrane-fusion protein)